MHNARSWVRVLARQLECCELATDVAVCGSALWMVAASDVLNCFSGSRVVVQRNGRCGALLSRGGASAIGTCQMATTPARSELERSRDTCFQAVCACPHLTFGSGSSLILRTVGLAHTMWSGSSIPFRLALWLRTCLPGPENILLTVCFRLALWTGQYSVVARALSLLCHVTVYDVDMMSVQNLGACNPLPRQLHPISKSSV